MKPKKRAADYEKIGTNDFVTGTIEDIAYDEEHKFQFKGEGQVKPAIRLKFRIEGYEYPHYSRWMTFTYGEQSNLYNKYLVPLVEGAQPDMDFDLDQLKGMKVKTLWAEKNGFEFVETIRPLNDKIKPSTEPIDSELEPDQETPF